MKILGLDVGSNSVGGALINSRRDRILGTFVRVFPEGVDRDQQGGEKSKSQARRTARGMRRQIARRNQRKRFLRLALQQVGLLPRGAEELRNLLTENPYELRAMGITGEPNPHQVGRALLHLGTRRGFLSNRKMDKGNDTKGMLAEIGELAETLADRGETLGEYLQLLDKTFEHRVKERELVEQRDQGRVRHRHTRRSMYEAEFEALWNKQRSRFPDLLTDRLKYGTIGKMAYPSEPIPLEHDGRLSPETRDERLAKMLLDRFGLYGLIFFQRKMYWPQSVVGQCELPNEDDRKKQCRRKRCPKADRIAQYFRILQEVNNLKVDRGEGEGEDRLTADERAIVIEALAATKEQSFSALRKKLGFAENMTFNLERGGRDKLKGNETDAIMASKRGIGPRWRKLEDAVKDQVIEICVFETHDTFALKRLVDECKLTPDEASRATAVSLPDGYMHFCRSAIERLIPHLEKGLLLMANDASDSALHAAGYLRPDERAIAQKRFLPPPPELPNPIVRQALYEVRKVVNAVIREHGKPDAIHIELAREAKKSFDERRDIRFENEKRRRQREKIAEHLVEEYGIAPSRANINRYVLWEEQERICLYCCNPISASRLYSTEVNIDHILPRWRSLDDSMANKVVCCRKCNDLKKDRTPREWLEHVDPERYQKMLQAARCLDHRKRQKLQQLDIVLDDFVARQLTDTSYIARCVKEYLEVLGVPVACTRGSMTKDLRHWWGLNNILDPERKGRKNRSDHRHHAVDALVVALTDAKRLHALANARGENMPAPWPNFLRDARNSILSTTVSHKVQRRIAEALHEATYYGPTSKPNRAETDHRPWAKDWVEEENTFVRRKPVESIENAKHLGKVRDKTIRAILEKHLRDQGVDPHGTKKFPKDVFKGTNTPLMPSRVPIKKVRMLEESETFRPLAGDRDFQLVKLGNNHHIKYWVEGDGEREKWSAEVVTMWDAAQRARGGLNPIDRTPPKGKRFVMSLSCGEMFQIVSDNGEIVLCVVRKMDQRSKRVFYKVHTDARESSQLNKDNLYLSPKAMQQRSARKVTVDPLGRVRWAND